MDILSAMRGHDAAREMQYPNGAKHDEWCTLDKQGTSY